MPGQLRHIVTRALLRPPSAPFVLLWEITGTRRQPVARLRSHPPLRYRPIRRGSVEWPWWHLQFASRPHQAILGELPQQAPMRYQSPRQLPLQRAQPGSRFGHRRVFVRVDRDRDHPYLTNLSCSDPRMAPKHRFRKGHMERSMDTINKASRLSGSRIH